MSTEWIHKKRERWPGGSLERHLALNYPGCKTAVDALKEILKLKAKIKDADKLASSSVVERLAVNQEVEGPIPSLSANEINKTVDDFEW